MGARVVVLAGPSGSGKSRLSSRLGLPVLRLDDFYKDAGDPTLPVSSTRGQTDWDDPASWDQQGALRAVDSLCSTGAAEIPTYDIGASRRTGTRTLTVDGLFVAEGIFAAEIVSECRDRGLLAAAICLVQPAWLTFLRRLARDLMEARKPPRVLVVRGWRLLRQQPDIIAHARDLGCEVLDPAGAERAVRALR